MESKVVLISQCIILTYLENRYNDILNTDSTEIINKVISTIKELNNTNLNGGDVAILENLKNLITSFKSSDSNVDNLVSSLGIILHNKQSILDAILKDINSELTDAQIISRALGIRSYLTYRIREHDITSVISKASLDINTGRLQGRTILEIATTLAQEIEKHTVIAEEEEDPAILSEIDIDDTKAISNVLSVAKEISSGDAVYRFGWKKFNKMLQGGIRRKEMGMIAALPHNYKSTLTLSLFMQAARLNKPILKDPSKKPLLIYISFEDNDTSYVTFMYNYIYYNEHSVMPNTSDVTEEEMSQYIKTNLQRNGWHIKVMRVDPSLWTYRKLTAKLLRYMASGFEIIGALIDYLAKLPTTGCLVGTGGVDYRDM